MDPQLAHLLKEVKDLAPISRRRKETCDYISSASMMGFAISRFKTKRLFIPAGFLISSGVSHFVSQQLNYDRRAYRSKSEEWHTFQHCLDSERTKENISHSQNAKRYYFLFE
jgi:hypothetical protein